MNLKAVTQDSVKWQNRTHVYDMNEVSEKTDLQKCNFNNFNCKG